MKVVLTHDVGRLGHKNTIVDVSDGYARNYLFPRNLATPATKGARKALDVIRKIDERKEHRLRGKASSLAEALGGLVLVIRAKTGERGRLYGSITARDVAQALHAEHGIEVDRRRIRLHDPIKSLGTHSVPITLANGAEVRLSIEIIPEDATEPTGALQEPPPPSVEGAGDSAGEKRASEPTT